MSKSNNQPIFTRSSKFVLFTHIISKLIFCKIECCRNLICCPKIVYFFYTLNFIILLLDKLSALLDDKKAAKVAEKVFIVYEDVRAAHKSKKRTHDDRDKDRDKDRDRNRERDRDAKRPKVKENDAKKSRSSNIPLTEEEKDKEKVSILPSKTSAPLMSSH